MRSEREAGCAPLQHALLHVGRFARPGAGRDLGRAWWARSSTLVVTLALVFPLGVSAAVYLEEFAPRNRWTDLIEVNINNLAAVPSIVFGLLGPRGVPRTSSGCRAPRRSSAASTLALMTLPTIIISGSRRDPGGAAFDPRGRARARRVADAGGAHHVLPLAMPGVLTGTIIGMARALGETAPLLMIGMVAFIVGRAARLHRCRDGAARADLPVGGQSRSARSWRRPPGRSSCCSASSSR